MSALPVQIPDAGNTTATAEEDYTRLTATVAISLVGTQNREALDNARTVAIWLRHLADRLRVARKIATDVPRLVELYGELLRAGFTIRHTPAAEAWILRGDWQFKAPKVLLLPDFFPTLSQVQASGEAAVLVSQHIRIVAMATRRSFDEGIEEGRRLEHARRDLQAPMANDELQAWKEERRQAHAEIMATLARKEHYIQRIQTLEAEIDRLTKRLAFSSHTLQTPESY